MTLSIEYIAGLFDGEGCISIYRIEHPKDGIRPKYQLQVAVTLREGWLLSQIQAQWGGSLYRQEPKSPKHAPIFRWRVGDEKAAPFLCVVTPHLHVKRVQAEIALHFRDHSGPSHRHDPTCIQIREDCYWVMRYENRQGVEKHG